MNFGAPKEFICNDSFHPKFWLDSFFVYESPHYKKEVSSTSEKDTINKTDASIIGTDDPAFYFLTYALEVTPMSRPIIDDSNISTPDQENAHSNDHDNDKPTSNAINA